MVVVGVTPRFVGRENATVRSVRSGHGHRHRRAVDAGWDGHLRTAVRDWSADTAGNPLNATVVAGAAKGRQCKPTAGRVEVCNGRYGTTGWSGIATIWIGSGGHITQGPRG